jgi:hypothetical protein
MGAHCGCALLWSVQPLPLLSLTPLPPTRHFSVAFDTHPCALHLHSLCFAACEAVRTGIWRGECWLSGSSCFGWVFAVDSHPSNL